MNQVKAITTRKKYLSCFKFTEHSKMQHTYNTLPVLLLHHSPRSGRGESQSKVMQGRSTNDFDHLENDVNHRDRIQHIQRLRI